MTSPVLFFCISQTHTFAIRFTIFLLVYMFMHCVNCIIPTSANMNQPKKCFIFKISSGQYNNCVCKLSQVFTI